MCRLNWEKQDDDSFFASLAPISVATVFKGADGGWFYTIRNGSTEGPFKSDSEAKSRAETQVFEYVTYLYNLLGGEPEIKDLELKTKELRLRAFESAYHLIWRNLRRIPDFDGKGRRLEEVIETVVDSLLELKNNQAA